MPWVESWAPSSRWGWRWRRRGCWRPQFAACSGCASVPRAFWFRWCRRGVQVVFWLLSSGRFDIRRRDRRHHLDARSAGCRSGVAVVFRTGCRYPRRPRGDRAHGKPAPAALARAGLAATVAQGPTLRRGHGDRRPSRPGCATSRSPPAGPWQRPRDGRGTAPPARGFRRHIHQARPDAVDEGGSVARPYIARLARLQNAVAPLPWDVVRERSSAELGVRSRRFLQRLTPSRSHRRPWRRSTRPDSWTARRSS